MSISEMNDQQVAGLASAICATAEAMGQEMNPGTAAIMAEDLCAYPVAVVKAALKACRFEVKGRLAMADILQRVQSADGRPGKDEAWAIALASNDEFDTVVMTDEIQVAMGAARPVLNLGDKVGARMAFISAYERLITKARDEATPVNWHVSVGFDANRRIEAITAAVQMKRIPRERGTAYLADLNVVPLTQDGLAIAGLITGKVAAPSADVRDRLKAIRDDLQLRARKRQLAKDHRARANRRELNEKINRQLEAAAELQARTTQ